MDASSVRPPRHVHPAELPALAERDMLTVYAATIDVPPLAPRVVDLQGGQSVQIDGVSPDEDLFVIPSAHQGPLPQDAAAYLARDLFALSLATGTRPHARTVLLFASQEARDSAAALLGELGDGVSLEVVDLGAEWTERLIEAARPAGRHRARAAGATAEPTAPPAPEPTLPAAPTTRRERREAARAAQATGDATGNPVQGRSASGRNPAADVRPAR